VDLDNLVVPEEDRAMAAYYTETTTRLGQFVKAEGSRMHKDGSLIPVEILGVPVIVSDEQIGIVGMYYDRTESKRYQEQLLQAKREAEDAATTKADFLANMSHEIRTPLNAVIGMTGLMLDTDLSSEQQDYTTTIRSSGETLLNIINDILDFSKIEAGKMDLEMQPFYLRDCVESALDLLATPAASKRIDLAYLIEDDVPSVLRSDITRLRQILVNLLGNAVKFTDQGEVVISVKVDEELGDQYRLQFSVQDTGIGIPEERMDRLFKSFSQIDSSTTRKYGGTGLGLTISEKLVKLLGGDIWVESEVGKYSIFHFTVVVDIDKDATPRPFRTGPTQFSGQRVLIVDDIEVNRRILIKQTASWGMLPTAVESGQEALEILRQGQKFDLAILDMLLPEMDGFTLAKEIRKYRSEEELPLMMLTSMGRSKSRKDDVKMAAFLAKPIKPSNLYDAMNTVLADQPHVESEEDTQPRMDRLMAATYPLRILIAEDNLVNQKVASGLLMRLGYRPDVVANGIEVIEAINRQPYDLILMDIQMPEMDGVATTSHIMEQWTTKDRPTIIAMTANAMQGDREKYLSLGMQGYISKPVNVEELIDALKKVQPLQHAIRVEVMHGARDH
jgi:signal transduction histidine kinase/DNA-binding response OmpR family regulator